MPDKLTVTSDESLEPSPADGAEQGASVDWRAENNRLRQALSQQKELNRKATPYVNLAVALQNSPGGPEIIEKLTKGETLSAKEEKAVQKIEAQVTREELEQLLAGERQNLFQMLTQTERAKQDMQELHTRAGRELPGYDELRKQPEWNRRLSVTLRMMQEQDPSTGEPLLAVPDDETDPYFFAIKETYDAVVAKHPEIGKKRVAAKTESERRGAIVKASPRSAGAPEEEQLPEEQAFARRPIRRTGIGGFGKSLQELRAPR